MKYYKILEKGRSCHGGNMKWSLPTKGRKGKWMTYDGELVPCESGIHLATKPHAWYTWNCDCYEAEIKGEHIDCKDHKIVCRNVRLIKKMQHPKWWRDCHDFVKKELPKIKWFTQHKKPLKNWKVFTAPTLWQARNAARDAAWGAAWDAAEAAAWDAARGAARDAARDAAGAAARDAAWGAARDAAGAAAWDAAWGAARDAALYAHCKYICSGLKLTKKHLKHVEDRMEVWRRGWALLCDVNGVLYVYGKEV